jgi:hypothetical protein
MKASPWAFLGLPQAPVPEAESADYGACRATFDGKRLVLRVAKTTPTKTGQFVTVWKRPHPDAEIAPLDEADPVDIVIIAVGDGDGAQHGFFIFPRSVLLERGVMSRAGSGGKRALRVYPPWCTPESGQALRTQRWQVGWFVGQEDLSGIVRLLQA